LNLSSDRLDLEWAAPTDSISVIKYQAEIKEKNRVRQEKWDRRYLDVAKQISSWSKDPSTRVGAVLVRNNRIVSVGYNGFPEGVDDSEERYNNRELKYELVVHAEVNAIVTAGHRAKGGTLYVYPGFGSPCMCTGCSKVAIQSGIRRVVGLIEEIDEERLARWKSSLALAQTLCDEAGIETKVY
jgi:dCMP deaminase